MSRPNDVMIAISNALCDCGYDARYRSTCRATGYIAIYVDDDLFHGIIVLYDGFVIYRGISKRISLADPNLIQAISALIEI